MDRRQVKRIERVNAVCGFLHNNAEELGPVAHCEAAQDLARLAQELMDATTSQAFTDRSIVGTAAAGASARTALVVRHMGPILAIARRKRTELPGLGKMRLPRKTQTREAVVTDARALADALEKHSAVFIKAGLEPDFLSQLRDAADKLHALGTHITRSQRVRATRQVAVVLADAASAIEVLHAFMKARFGTRHAQMTEWEHIKRVGAVGVRRAPIDESATQSALPAPPFTYRITASPTGGSALLGGDSVAEILDEPRRLISGEAS